MPRLVLSLTILCTWHAVAQAEAFWTPPPLPSVEARVIEVASTIDRELAQLDVLAEASAWEQAVDTVLRLAGDSSSELVEVAPGYYVPLVDACQMRVARWPAEGLAAYRERMDGVAAALLAEATRERSAAKLRRVATEYRMTHSGDDALLALADLALEQGHTATARGYLLSVSPRLSTSDHRPWGAVLDPAMADGESQAELVDDFQQADEVPSADRFPLTYPDTDIPLGDLLARLAMISIREQNLPRARLELQLLRSVSPQAEGHVAGRQMNLAEAVGGALESASDWPAIPTATTTPLGELRHPAWQQQLEDSPVHLAPAPMVWSGDFLSAARPSLPAQPKLVEPLVTGQAVAYREADEQSGTLRWRVLDLESGGPLFGERGELYSRESTSTAPRRVAAQPRIVAPQQLIVQGNARIVIRGNGQLILGDGSIRGLGSGWAQPTGLLASIEGSTFYGVTGESSATIAAPGERRSASRLVGLDLAAEGKLRLEIECADAYEFSGPPVVDGDSIYLPLRQTEGLGRLEVACYARSTGRRRWQVPVAMLSGEEPTGYDRITAGQGMLFVPTNAGVLVAMHAGDGRVAWARSYQRGTTTQPSDLSQATRPEQGSTLLAGGALVCAPSDAAAMFALEPVTGRVLWTNRLAFAAQQLVGVATGRLVASGDRLQFIDPATGWTQFEWPDNSAAGVAGRGRAAIAGDEIFWPTADAILTFSATTGQQTRSPIDLAALGGPGGANLVATNAGLLVATRTKLSLLADRGAPPTKQEAPTPPPLSTLPPPTDSLAAGRGE